MAPKAKPPVNPAKVKVAEDKTFGMKNKNKSKVVQKYIKSIHQNSGVTKSSIEEKAEKKEKADKEAAAKKGALMASLFNLQTDKKGKAYDPIAKKKAEQLEKEAIAAGKKLKDAIKKDIIEGIANTIRLTNPKAGIRMSELGGHPIIAAMKEKHADTFRTIQLLLFIKGHDQVFWCDDPEAGNPFIRCQEDVDAEVAPDERSIEEILEERRACLVGPGTPITEETFKAWKEKKMAESNSKVEWDKAEQVKKAGRAGMSGRDLFKYDASLFVDDDGAASAGEMDEREDRLETDSEGSDDEPAPKAVPEANARKGAEAEAEDEEDEEDEEEFDEEALFGGECSTGAVAKPEAAGEVAINKDLFLQEADDLDDLDDLDD